MYFIVVIIYLDQDLSFSNFIDFIAKSDLFSLKNILFLSIFTFFNWFIEIKKWQNLVKSIQNISFFEATKQSLSSLTFSLITPNRIGEYGAKALYYKKEKRKKILFLNFAGNFYQLLVTLLLGILGILYLPNYYNHLGITTEWVILIILSVFIIFILARFLSKKIKWLQKVKDFWKLQNNQLIIVLSLLRYLIFSHQFYFLLMIFDVDISYFNAMACITSMYFISSIVPMLSLFDVVLKGSVSLFVFSWLGYVSPTAILVTVSLMWILNFAIPSIIGSYFVLKFKPQKR